jgi:phosphoglycolate phosphatase
MMTVVCFDLDGTLIDSSVGIHASLQQACLQEGVRPPEYEALVSCIGPPLGDYLPSLLNISEKECQGILAAFRIHHDTVGFLDYRLYPGAESVLSKLENNGHLIYAATNKPFAISCAALRHFGLLERFLNVYCPDGSVSPSGLHDHSKRTVLTHLRLCSDPADVVYVGDTASDQVAATEANVGFIHAAYGYGCGILSEQRIDTLRGLLSLIR